MKRKSEKSYVVAVCLSGIFGLIGVQHFYLGRWVPGIADVLMTFAWFYYFFIAGLPLIGLIFLALDCIHTLVTTILLLIGEYRDGTGAYVCYPNQKLT